MIADNSRCITVLTAGAIYCLRQLDDWRYLHSASFCLCWSKAFYLKTCVREQKFVFQQLQFETISPYDHGGTS